MNHDQITKLADRIMSRIEADQAIHKDALIETILEAVTLAHPHGYIAAGASSPMETVKVNPRRWLGIDWGLTEGTQAVTIGSATDTTITRGEVELGFVCGQTRLDPGGDEWTLDETFERIVRVRGSHGRVDWMTRGEWKAMPVKMF